MTYNLNSWKLGGGGLSMILTLGAGRESGFTGTCTPLSQSCFHVSVIIQYEDCVSGSLSGSFMALIRSFLKFIDVSPVSDHLMSSIQLVKTNTHVNKFTDNTMNRYLIQITNIKNQDTLPISFKWRHII